MTPEKGVAIHNRRYYQGRNGVAIILAIIGIAALVGILYFIFRNVGSESSPDDSAGESSQGPSRDDFSGRVNDAVRPCDNFYQHACSRYKTNSFIQAHKSVVRKAKAIVSSPEERADGEWTRFAKRMYSKCVKEAKSSPEESSAVVYAKLLTRLWSTNFGSSPPTSYEQPPVSFTDEKFLDPPMLQDYLGKTLLTKEEPSSASRSTSFHSKIQDYKYFYKYMTKILTLLGLAESRAKTVSKMVIAFQRNVEMKMQVLTYQIFLLRLRRPNLVVIDMTDEGDEDGNSTSNVINPEIMFKQVVYPLRNQTGYIYGTLWDRIEELVPVMPYEFRKVLAKFEADDPEETPMLDPEESCYEVTSNTVNFALVDMTIGQVVDEESKQELREMIENIRQEFEDVVMSTSKSWLSPIAARKFIEMFRTVKINFGLPDVIKGEMYNRRILTEVQDALDDPQLDTFIGYYLKARSWMSEKVRLNDSLLTEWLLHDLTKTNAALDQNGITIYAGALMPPMFDKRQAMALNYGGVGAMIAHEFMHSLFLTAAKGISSFFYLLQIAHCFKQQYEERLEFGVRHAYVPSTDEDFADHGGIIIAYNAYVNHYQSRHKSVSQPVEDQKLFFVSYAQSWCDSPGEKDAVPAHLEYLDTHSPARFRVNIPLCAFKPFSKVMGCSVNDDMYYSGNCLYI